LIVQKHLKIIKSLSIKSWVCCLDHIGTLFCHHIDGVLDAAIRDDREDGGVNDSESLDTVNFKLAVKNALFNVFRKTSGPTWI
jgi:hypothetical protein